MSSLICLPVDDWALYRDLCSINQLVDLSEGPRFASSFVTYSKSLLAHFLARSAI